MKVGFHCSSYVRRNKDRTYYMNFRGSNEMFAYGNYTFMNKN